MLASDFSKEEIDKFWSLVDKTGGCWYWTGPVFLDGYGRFNVRGKMFRANRVSYALANNYIDEDLLVCHTCDVRLCVAQDHLFSGTHSDNSKDMASKGRCNPFTIIGVEDIFLIREMYNNGIRQYAIADTFNINQGTVSRIVNGLRRART